MRKMRKQQILLIRKRRQKPTGHLQMAIRHRVLTRVMQRSGTVIRNENYRKTAAQTK